MPCSQHVSRSGLVVTFPRFSCLVLVSLLISLASLSAQSRNLRIFSFLQHRLGSREPAQLSSSIGCSSCSIRLFFTLSSFWSSYGLIRARSLITRAERCVLSSSSGLHSIRYLSLTLACSDSMCSVFLARIVSFSACPAGVLVCYTCFSLHPAAFLSAIPLIWALLLELLDACQARILLRIPNIDQTWTHSKLDVNRERGPSPSCVRDQVVQVAALLFALLSLFIVLAVMLCLFPNWI